MEHLRWILLLLGGVVLLLVYWISRQRRNDTVGDDDPNDHLINESGEYLFDKPDHDALFDDVSVSVGKSPTSKSPGLVEGDMQHPLPSRISHKPGIRNQLLAKKEASSGATLVSPPVSLDVADDTQPNSATGPALSVPTVADDTRQPRFDEPAQVEKIVELHICAHAGEALRGSDLVRIFKARGYEFGEMDIYHSRFQGNTIFSIINMVEPGWFDPQTMEEFTTPGISLFMRLPAPLAGDTAFEVLLNEARSIAKRLNAVLLDANRSTLTRQMEQHIREELKQYNFQRKHSANRL